MIHVKGGSITRRVVQREMARKRTFVEDLVDGMKLVEDVFTPDGQLLVGKGAVITPRIIARLKFYTILYVYVEQTAVEKPKEEISYYKRIESTMDFKRFNHSLKSEVHNFEQFVNNALLYNQEINTAQLLDGIDEILADSGNGIRLINMLQCIRSYDDIIYVHSVNVALICSVLGEWFHMAEADRNVLVVAGLLHDIGKIVLPKEILSKTSKLSEDEYRLIKQHTLKGYDLMKDKEIDERIKLAILQHHERNDGTGYPYGIKDQEINEFAKIIAIADVYDAMTSNRVYRQGICPFDVIETIEKEGYQKYDAQFLLPFLQRISECYVNAEVRLSDGRDATVIMLNNSQLSRPMVKVGEEYINLADHMELSIASLI